MVDWFSSVWYKKLQNYFWFFISLVTLHHDNNSSCYLYSYLHWYLYAMYFYPRDGNLHEGDQILAINGQRIDTGLSHQDAIGILQRTHGHVELIVARGGIQRAPSDVSRQPSVASSSFISRSNSGASSSSMASMPVSVVSLYIMHMNDYELFVSVQALCRIFENF